jgi:PAS domain S-box-containing protein
LDTVGHALIDEAGDILSVNDAFSAIIGAPAQKLVGRSVEELTAPPDREECAIAIGKLRQTGRSFTISKRFIRADGSLVWVTNFVSIARIAIDRQILTASIVPVSNPSQYRSPARLMQCAKSILEQRKQLSLAFGSGLAPDPAWDVLLLAYVAEGEGASLMARDLAPSFGESQAQLSRWVVLLLESGLMEIEGLDGGSALQFQSDLPLRLTAKAHKKLEDELAKLAIQRRDLVQA